MTRTRSPFSARPGTRRAVLTAGATLTALTLAACGGGDPLAEDAETETDDTASAGSITVGGANFTEMAVMQQMYVLLLEDAGYDVETISADNRELYFPEVGAGNIDVIPEYAATLVEFVNIGANGEGATPIATNDIAATIEASTDLLAEEGVTFLEPAEAASQNGFAVTQEFAETNDLTTLTDLGALGETLKLATTEECESRPFCQPGLEATYGLTFDGDPLTTGFSTTQTKTAVQDGLAQLALVGTTDATLDQFGLVVLEDDKGLQLADNLVPLVSEEAAGDEKIAEALNKLAGVLTTEDLAGLNLQVDAERQQAPDVARAYLEENELIG